MSDATFLWRVTHRPACCHPATRNPLHLLAASLPQGASDALAGVQSQLGGAVGGATEGATKAAAQASEAASRAAAQVGLAAVADEFKLTLTLH